MTISMCDQHSGHEGRICSLEKDRRIHGTKLDDVSKKLNMVLGAVVLSPFLVALLVLLLKTK